MSEKRKREARSQFWPLRMNTPPSARLEQKSSTALIRLLAPDASWDDIMLVANEEAPRVGIKTSQEGQLSNRNVLIK